MANLMGMGLTLRRLRASILASALSAALAAQLAAPVPAATQPAIQADVEARDPKVVAMSKRLARLDPPRYNYDDAIVERQLITARDGVTTLALDIIRPDTTRRVPTIFFQSPYYNTVGRGMNGERKTPWSERLARTPQPWAAFPEWYDEYFVPRGYAVVMMDQRGTRNSSGCQVYGGREEATDAVDGIEWIAEQPWSNGSVGMTGGSYDGTVATAAASEAPRALKAIIPIRAIGRWYDYHFFNGMQSASHLLTPWSFTTLTPLTDSQNSEEEDPLFGLHLIERKACAASIGALVAAQYSTPYQDSTSSFWSDRDWLQNPKFKAATFIIHGLHDWNVKTSNALHLWQAIPKRVPKKLLWAQMEHGDPMEFFRARFVTYTHAWFAEHLKKIRTGVMQERPVTVERGGRWRDDARWPPASRDVTFYLDGKGLGRRPVEGEITYGNGVFAGESTFRTPTFSRATRVAGQAFLRLTYSLSQGGDTGFAYRLEVRGPDAQATADETRAYARGAYRDEIRRRGASYPTAPSPHVPGETYEIAFPFLPHDFTIPAGGHLRLTILGSDGRVLPAGTGGDVTLHLGEDTKLVIPTRTP